jgi:5'-nucleotidase (lipoprotein e(P4) family)
VTTGLARAALLLAAASTLSGCVAAAIPVAAGGGVLRGELQRRSAARRPAPIPAAAAVPATAAGTAAVAATPETDAGPPAVAPEVQYLYGSGEAAALSLQAYQALWNFIKVEIGLRIDKAQIRSVVLAPGATLENPRFDPCGKRPLAVVLDIDETVLLNLGFESDTAARGAGYDEARWSRWEASGADKVAAVPGAAETLAAVRREGLTIVFNSNRAVTHAQQTAAALEHAGLGPAVLGDTLWLRDPSQPGGKDARRWRIAERYCVVAMAGDQLGDFSDLFNAAPLGVRARRNSAKETMVAPLWGAGWFILPNPVYGTALKGGLDDIFPPETRWSDPQEKK